MSQGPFSFYKIDSLIFIFDSAGSWLLCTGFLHLGRAGFLLPWLLSLQNTGSRQAASVAEACGPSSCGSRAQEPRLSNQWHTGLAGHVGSSWTRD